MSDTARPIIPQRDITAGDAREWGPAADSMGPMLSDDMPLADTPLASKRVRVRYRHAGKAAPVLEGTMSATEEVLSEIIDERGKLLAAAIQRAERAEAALESETAWAREYHDKWLHERDRAEAQLADAITRIAELDAENDGLRGCIAQGRGMNIFIVSSDRDENPAPCQKCGEDVIEFSIPNRLWNKVIRIDGHEQEQEYLCIRCFYDMAFEWMERAEAQLSKRTAEVERLAAQVGEIRAIVEGARNEWYPRYLSALYTALAAPPEAAVCEWTSDDDGVWFTSCGDAHQFTVDGPAENHYSHCPYCGKRLQVAALPSAGDDVDGGKEQGDAER